MNRKELLIRTITGACLLTAVVFIVLCSDNAYVMKGAVSVIGMIAVWEICHVSDALRPWFYSASMLLLALLTPFIDFWGMRYVLIAVYAASVICFAVMMRSLEALRLDSRKKTTALCLAVMILLRSFCEITLLKNGQYWLGLSITVCFSTDIFAYLLGRIIGRHKLSPQISPGKTVEGSVAGTLCALICGCIYTKAIASSIGAQINYPILITAALTLSIAGQFGDLAMSAVKRICHVKDFGRLLPGHGGILDRIDSLIMAVPISYILCCFGLMIIR